jgi:hypothetical protein
VSSTTESEVMASSAGRSMVQALGPHAVVDSQPLSGLPSQSYVPTWHAVPHVPATQTPLAVPEPVQLVPQVPQWSASAVRSTSQPLSARPSQFA